MKVYLQNHRDIIDLNLKATRQDYKVLALNNEITINKRKITKYKHNLACHAKEFKEYKRQTDDKLETLETMFELFINKD